MKRRLAITREGDNIGRRTLSHHAFERLRQHLAHIITAVEATLAGVFVIPATLTVYAIEATQLRLYGQQIDTQREAETT